MIVPCKSSSRNNERFGNNGQTQHSSIILKDRVLKVQNTWKRDGTIVASPSGVDLLRQCLNIGKTLLSK